MQRILFHFPSLLSFPVGLQLFLNLAVFLPGLGEVQAAAGVGLEVIIIASGRIQHGMDGFHTWTANRSVGKSGVLVGVVRRIVFRVRQGDDVLLDAFGVLHRDAGLQLGELVRMAQAVQEDAGHGLPVFRGSRFALHHGGQDDDLVQSVFALGDFGQNILSVDFLFKVVQHGGDDRIHVLILRKVIGIREKISLQAVNPLGGRNVLEKFVVELMGLAGADELRTLADTGIFQDGSHLSNLNSLWESHPDVAGRLAHDVADLEEAATSGNLVGTGIPAVVPAFEFGHGAEQQAPTDEPLLLQLVGHDDGPVSGVHGDFGTGSACGDAGGHDNDGTDKDHQRGNACDDDISLLSHTY